VRANSPAAKTNPCEQRVVRCAIYARKSTEEGLAQPFNSLDAQRESAEAYISSQRHRGWTALERRYDDGATRQQTWNDQGYELLWMTSSWERSTVSLSTKWTV
jgi:hypothetical protein